MRRNRCQSVGVACAALAVGWSVTANADAQDPTIYRAELHALNSGTTGAKAKGEAIFTIDGDQLTITIDAQGLPPNMMHLHFTALRTAMPLRVQTLQPTRTTTVSLISSKPNHMPGRRWSRSTTTR